MLGFLRTLILAVMGLGLGLLGASMIAANITQKEAASAPAVVQGPATTSAQKTASMSPTTTPATPETKTTTAVPKKPAPAAPVPSATKPSDVLTPGTPEYQKSLQDAMDALAKLNASTGPATPLNDRVRRAVVNINCTAGAGGLNSISGSGVIIDPRGIIVTNSHVAQYFLLRNYPTPNSLTCIIRTGSPAYPTYTAELLFMPPSWIAKNARQITEHEPTGNGEHDYAFLRVTGMVNPSESLPAGLPYIPPSYAEPVEGANVLIAGYAAGFLGGAEVAKNLYASSAYGKIGEIYTYANNMPDIYSLGGSIVAQQGSSGGAVADEAGSLIGVVVTSTIAADTASRDLRALAFSYIAADFAKESGVVFSDFLARDLAREAALFHAGIAPTLTRQLTDALRGQ